MDTATLARDLCVTTLKDKFYATLECPIALRARSDTLMWAWRHFLALPEEERKGFGYLTDERVSGSGYEFPDSAKRDFKHVFHAQLRHADWLFDRAERFRKPDRTGVEAKALVEESLGMIKFLRPHFRRFGKAVEQEFDVGSFADDLEKTLDECIIRFLYYPPGSRAAGEEFAVPHPDKGGFTIHLCETAPGVERMTADKQWVSLPTPAGQSVIFGGMRLQRRNHNLKALYHRVVATPETAERGRYAIVLFGNFAGTDYYDKQRIGPTQVHAHGFNYDIPADQFAELFRAA